MNKSELEKLVEIRVQEANLLLNSNCYQGAYYLIGYALECAFKVCISRQVKAFDFPDKRLANASHTHKLSDLVGVAGLKQKLKKQENYDENFKLNWAVAKDWSESSRYECIVEENRVRDLYKAITDNKSGILTWLKKYW